VARVVVRQVAARPRGRERQRERDRRELEHGKWLEQPIATMYARLDARRRALDGVEAAEQAFAAALQALVSDPEGARFVAQCPELDAVEVQRLIGRLDVS
jgi:hypothetical protein